MTVDDMLDTLMSMKKAGCGNAQVKYRTDEAPHSEELYDINIVSLNTDTVVLF